MSRHHATVPVAIKELPPLKRLLLAVSGGIDSVCLLHAIQAIAKPKSLVLEVAHIDHGLRPQSKKDAAFVEKLAKKYKLPFHFKKASKPPARSNIEAWGRKVRYDFFASILKKRKLHYVVTAHNANDVAETFLMRILANKEPNSILAYDPVRHCLRPFLKVTRKEIEKYVGAHELSFVEDETNKDPRFLRNKIRNELIPFLENEFGNTIVESLSIRALAWAQDIQSLKAQAQPLSEELEAHDFGSKAWLKSLRAGLKTLPVNVHWRLAEGLFLPKLGFNLGRKHSELLLEVLRGNRVGVELPSGIKVRARQGGLFVSSR